MGVNKLRGMIFSRYQNAKDFADELGWPSAKLRLILRGKARITVEDASAISKALGLSLEEFFGLLTKELKAQ